MNSPSDETRCRYCGAKLSLLQRLGRHEFCSPEHRSEYQKEQESLALARLQQATLAMEAATGAGLADQPSDGVKKSADPPYGELTAIPLEPRSLLAPAHGDGVDPAAVVTKPSSPRLTVRSAVPSAWPMAGKAPVDSLVRPRPGDVLTILELDPLAEVVGAVVEFPSVSVVPFDWEKAKQARRAEDGPPLAGLVPLEGPQTLRFESLPTRMDPTPLPAEAKPNTTIRWSGPASARKSSPKLAGRVRPSWKTRFGTPGDLRPRNAIALLEPTRRAAVRVLRPRCPFSLDTTMLPSAMRVASIEGHQLRRAELCEIRRRWVDYTADPRLHGALDFEWLSISRTRELLERGVRPWLAPEIEPHPPAYVEFHHIPPETVSLLDEPRSPMLRFGPGQYAIPFGGAQPASSYIRRVTVFAGHANPRHAYPMPAFDKVEAQPPAGPSPFGTGLRVAGRVPYSPSRVGIRHRIAFQTALPEGSEWDRMAIPSARLKAQPDRREPPFSSRLFPMRGKVVSPAEVVRRRMPLDPGTGENWHRFWRRQVPSWLILTRRKGSGKNSGLPNTLGVLRIPLQVFDADVEPIVEPLACSFESGGGSWDSLI